MPADDPVRSLALAALDADAQARDLLEPGVTPRIAFSDLYRYATDPAFELPSAVKARLDGDPVAAADLERIIAARPFTYMPRQATAATDGARRVAGAIKQASNQTGVSFEYMLTTAKMESDFDPSAGATTSATPAAAGRFITGLAIFMLRMRMPLRANSDTERGEVFPNFDGARLGATGANSGEGCGVTLTVVPAMSTVAGMV